MAETSFDVNSFGITDTKVVGNYEAAEEFLSSSDDIINEDPAKLKSIAEEKKKEEALKKKVPIKKKEDEEEEDKEEEKEPTDPFDEIDKEVPKTKEEEKEEEDKEEEKKEDEEEKEKEEDKEKEESTNSYEDLSKDLFKLGVFTQQENEAPIKTGAELLNRFQVEAQTRATQWIDEFLGRFGDDRREIFEAIYINGVDPSEYIPVHNEVQKFEGMDLTVDENKKIVYREFYKRLGWDDTKVEKKLQKTIDYGDLEEEVPDLHEQIINQDKQKLQEMEESRAAQLSLQKRIDGEYKTGLQTLLVEASKTKEFKGIPVTEKKAREAFDFLYTPKYKTSTGQLLTEFDKFILESKKPENLEQRLILAFLKLDGFDFKDIKKQAVSEQSKEIFSSLASKVTKDKSRATKTTGKENSGSSWSDI